MHCVFFAEVVVVSIVQHCGPFVVICGNGLTQCDGNFGESEAVSKLFCHVFISFVVYFTLCYVCIRSFDAEYIGSVLFVSDAYVNILAELAHHLSGFFLGPQFVSVVQVAGNSNAGFFCGLACLQTDSGNIIIEGRCDSCKVEPVCSVEDFFPIEI